MIESEHFISMLPLRLVGTDDNTRRIVRDYLTYPNSGILITGFAFLVSEW